MVQLVIVIVNYRTSLQVCDCLQSLYKWIPKDYVHVYVVDNHSGDGSVELFQHIIQQKEWHSWITVLPARSNRGFAAGNNIAIRLVLASDSVPDYIMLLNPDTVVEEGAIQHLIQFLDNHINVGVVGALLKDEHFKIVPSGRRFPSISSEFDSGARLGLLSKILKHRSVTLPAFNSAFRCDWVSGAAMMIRSQVFEKTELMDEGYFLYFEELDFCHLVANTEWQVWVEPKSLIVHMEGQATGIRNSQKRRGAYWYASRRRYFVKHHGVLYLLIVDLVWALGRCSLLLRKLFGFGGDISSDPSWFMYDLVVGDIVALIKGELLRVRKSTR